MIKYTFLLLIVLGSCTLNRQLGYFEVSPYAKVQSNKIEQPLYLRFSTRINDTYVFKHPGFGLTAVELHKSYLYASQRAFGDLFSEVKSYTQGDLGFILELQQMEPRWSFHENMKINQFKDTFEYQEAWCTMYYASTIYRNDLLVSQSEGRVVVKQNELGTYKLEEIFKEAVKQSIAAMAQEHYNKR